MTNEVQRIEILERQIANLVKVNDEVWKNIFHLTKKVTFLEKENEHLINCLEKGVIRCKPLKPL